MKIGMIARAEDRGLGIQTWEWHRHMRPERTLIVDTGGDFPLHLGRYGLRQGRPAQGTIVARFGGSHFAGGDAAMIRRWLTGLDVVYTAETWYDPRFPAWCRAAGVRLVVHVNPEFMRPAMASEQGVTWWAPTPWRLAHLPSGTKVVPVPVPLDRWPAPVERFTRLRVLHVAGKPALGDRNGTRILRDALPLITEPMKVTIAAQRPVGGNSAAPEHVTVEHVEHARDYWDLYADHDVLVLPRRYGGLCLPAHEAAGAGLVLAMPATSPNMAVWPAVPFPARPSKALTMPCGPVTTYDADPADVAAALDGLARSEMRFSEARRATRAWAKRSSWEQLEPLIRSELAAACE